MRGARTATGETIAASAVISNMDALRTYRELVGGETAGATRAPAMSRRVRGWCSISVSRKRYEHLAHHDFVFSESAEDEFDHDLSPGEPAPDPTCYLAAPSSTEPAVAPPGGEALYVLVHTPYLRPHHDWKAMFPAYRQRILDKLKRTAGLVDIEDRIVFERHLTPQDIHDRYKVLNGAIYGLASHGKFTGAFKPGNRSRHLQRPLPRRWGGASRAGDADGDDVRLDRRRRPGRRSAGPAA